MKNLQIFRTTHIKTIQQSLEAAGFDWTEFQVISKPPDEYFGISRSDKVLHQQSGCYFKIQTGEDGVGYDYVYEPGPLTRKGFSSSCRISDLDRILGIWIPQLKEEVDTFRWLEQLSTINSGQRLLALVGNPTRIDNAQQTILISKLDSALEDIKKMDASAEFAIISERNIQELKEALPKMSDKPSWWANMTNGVLINLIASAIDKHGKDIATLVLKAFQ